MMGSSAVHGLPGSGLCVGNSPSVNAGMSVAGYDEAQLKIAATIIMVGQTRGIDQHGQMVAVMVGMGESGLRNLDHGDAVDNSTIGVFQQGVSYGPREDRLNIEKAAGAFYDRMIKVPDWASMDPSGLAHTVQVNADPNHYAEYVPAATRVVAALTGPDGGCRVPADAKDAARQLVSDADNGKLTFLENRYRQQVVNMANGTATPECTLDVHVLQIMVLAVNSFQQVGVSDLNRRCTGETPGAGTASQHWKGKAVDFYSLNRRSLTGSDELSAQLIRLLDPLVPHGSGIGQRDCRQRTGDPITGLVNFTSDFPDTCNHQHVQVP
jgi:hypothetical protein